MADNDNNAVTIVILVIALLAVVGFVLFIMWQRPAPQDNNTLPDINVPGNININVTPGNTNSAY